MFILCNHGDSFRCEDGINADISDEVSSGGSEQKAQFLEREQLNTFQFFIDIRDFSDEFFWSIIA